MRYTITKQRIYVIGTIWMPSATCAQVYDLSSYDMENLGDPRDRANVERWLDTHAGDFQSVTDFRADFDDALGNIIHEWKDEESELTFNDCMFPSFDE